jgi:molybdopterin-biosynthesis enzyme MoeA-like protein
MNDPQIYAIIIGSEILNGRRVDKHFDFIKKILGEREYFLHSLQIIKDDYSLIKSSFEMVFSNKKSMLFCFGGIGSTPDDLTRAIAAEVFTSKPLIRHQQFERDIIDKFGERAFPNRIIMADLPQGASLLKNPVNNMSGFFLNERFFFTPGFPKMAHPMVKEAIERFLPQNRILYRNTFVARCSEEKFVATMKTMSKKVECSSLPMFVDGKANVEISVASYFEEISLSSFNLFVEFMNENEIVYEIKA